MEKYENETIAAIATALSDSGIGIVRISGDNAIYIVDNVFRSASGKRILTKVQSHTIHYGYIVDQNENVIDEVMAVVMKAPKSYTMEDTVEINCHGGVLVMQKVLETVLQAGARLAEPGEFTKRAFLNGRIDLSRAEAVIDVIHSQNEYALSSSVSQLKGQLSDKIHSLREDILYQIAFIESALDDPEHISLEGYPEQLAGKVNRFEKEIQKLLATADNGRLIKEGISTVIVGKPNAGKSSLLNMLLGEDRAIVTEIAGTTRDALHETINLHGISLNMIDTAGIHETQDVVEKIGVERAKKYAVEADLILYVVDASGDLDENDREIISLLEGKKAIILLNKSDLENRSTEDSLKDSLTGVLEHTEEIQILRVIQKGIGQIQIPQQFPLDLAVFRGKADQLIHDDRLVVEIQGQCNCKIENRKSEGKQSRPEIQHKYRRINSQQQQAQIQGKLDIGTDPAFQSDSFFHERTPLNICVRQLLL